MQGIKDIQITAVTCLRKSQNIKESEATIEHSEEPKTHPHHMPNESNLQHLIY